MGFLRFCDDLYTLLHGIEERTVAGLFRHYYAHVLDIHTHSRNTILWKLVDSVLNANRHLYDSDPNMTQDLDRLREHCNSLMNANEWPLPEGLEFLMADTASEFVPQA